MKIKEAIQKAIEGGYSLLSLAKKLGIKNLGSVDVGTRYILVSSYQGNTKQLCSFEKIFLDPSFWKALGKSLGWEEDLFYQASPVHSHIGETMDESLWYWLNLIRHLSEGGSIEDYFKDL